MDFVFTKKWIIIHTFIVKDVRSFKFNKVISLWNIQVIKCKMFLQSHVPVPSTSLRLTKWKKWDACLIMLRFIPCFSIHHFWQNDTTFNTILWFPWIHIEMFLFYALFENCLCTIMNSFPTFKTKIWPKHPTIVWQLFVILGLELILASKVYLQASKPIML